MPNASTTIKEIAICSVKYFEELLGNLENENLDFVPVKDAKLFLSGKICKDVDLFLSQSKDFFISSDFICFIEFWRLYEELLKYSGAYSFLQSYDGILNGMIYLRDRIVGESINQAKMNDLTKLSVTNHTNEPGRVIGITVGQIHTIILEIISNNICSDNSSAYWQDVLNQIPQDGSSSMFLELVDVSHSILQWLKEYFSNLNETSIYSTSTIVTRMLSIKEDTIHNPEYEEVDYKSDKTLSKYQTKRVDEKNENDNHCNSIIENYDSSEFYLDTFECLPWRGQTMFSNFRELQISLQSILERVILHSDKGKSNFFLKRDEVIIRKISHMITELEDYLYNQFDVINKERDKSEKTEVENKNLKKQLKEVIEETEEYKFEIQNSINQKSRYEKELENFLLQKNKLSSDLIHLKEENKSLERKFEELSYSYNDLKERHESLLEENNHLINEINKYNERSKNENSEACKYNVCLASKKDENSPCLKLDQNMVAGDTHEINSLIVRLAPNKINICKNYLKESSSCKGDDESYESAAIISSIPDFLESTIKTPISCRSYGQKFGYFPENAVDKELRIVNVVSPITERNIENCVDQKRPKNTLIKKKENLSKMVYDRGCMFQ